MEENDEIMIDDTSVALEDDADDNIKVDLNGKVSINYGTHQGLADKAYAALGAHGNGYAQLIIPQDGGRPYVHYYDYNYYHDDNNDPYQDPNISLYNVPTIEDCHKNKNNMYYKFKQTPYVDDRKDGVTGQRKRSYTNSGILEDSIPKGTLDSISVGIKPSSNDVSVGKAIIS